METVLLLSCSGAYRNTEARLLLKDDCTYAAFQVAVCTDATTTQIVNSCFAYLVSFPAETTL